MGGYETTASALAFAVQFIAQHPHVEAKLLAEVDAFGREAAPTYDSCDQVGRMIAPSHCSNSFRRVMCACGAAAKVYGCNRGAWLAARLLACC